MVKVNPNLLASWQFADVNTGITPARSTAVQQKPAQFAAAGNDAINTYRPAAQVQQKPVQFADADNSAKQKKAKAASAELYLMAAGLVPENPFISDNSGGGMSGFGIADSRFIAFA